MGRDVPRSNLVVVDNGNAYFNTTDAFDATATNAFRGDAHALVGAIDRDVVWDVIESFETTDANATSAIDGLASALPEESRYQIAQGSPGIFVGPDPEIAGATQLDAFAGNRYIGMKSSGTRDILQMELASPTSPNEVGKLTLSSYVMNQVSIGGNAGQQGRFEVYGIATDHPVALPLSDFSQADATPGSGIHYLGRTGLVTQTDDWQDLDFYFLSDQSFDRLLITPTGTNSYLAVDELNVFVERPSAIWEFTNLEAGKYQVSATVFDQWHTEVPYRVYHRTPDGLIKDHDEVIRIATTTEQSLSASDSSVLVTSIGASPGGLIQIGSEIMRVTDVTDHGNGTQTYTVERGFDDTIALAHPLGSQVKLMDRIFKDGVLDQQWLRIADTLSVPASASSYYVELVQSNDSEMYADAIRFEQIELPSDAESISLDVVDEDVSVAPFYHVEHCDAQAELLSHDFHSEFTTWTFDDVPPGDYLILTDWDGTDDGVIRFLDEATGQFLTQPGFDGNNLPIILESYVGSVAHPWRLFDELTINGGSLTVRVNSDENASVASRVCLVNAESFREEINRFDFTTSTRQR